MALNLWLPQPPEIKQRGSLMLLQGQQQLLLQSSYPVVNKLGLSLNQNCCFYSCDFRTTNKHLAIHTHYPPELPDLGCLSKRLSPSQQWLPMFNFQGYFMCTAGLMITPFPTVAPNTRSQNIFILDDIFQDPLIKQQLIRYQRPLLNLEPGLYQSLLYVDKLHCIYK